MRNYKEIMGRRLLAARVIVRRQNQDCIAEAVKISKEKLYGIERGKSEAKITDAIKLASALQVPITWLIGVRDADEGTTLYEAERKILTMMETGEKIQPIDIGERVKAALARKKNEKL